MSARAKRADAFEGSSYRNGSHQQDIEVVVVCFTFIQPYEDVD
jgi:hypothetical protein